MTKKIESVEDKRLITEAEVLGQSILEPEPYVPPKTINHEEAEVTSPIEVSEVSEEAEVMALDHTNNTPDFLALQIAVDHITGALDDALAGLKAMTAERNDAQAQRDDALACNHHARRDAMRELRVMVAMPAEGECVVLGAVARALEKTLLYSSDNARLTRERADVLAREGAALEERDKARNERDEAQAEQKLAQDRYFEQLDEALAEYMKYRAECDARCEKLSKQIVVAEALATVRQQLDRFRR